ncbi:hypothetical protein D3C72_2022320 [compost metagenome]
MDMAAQRVQLVGVRQRHGDFLDLAAELLQLSPDTGAVRVGLLHLMLNGAQPSIPLEHPRTHAELVERWNDA